MELTSQLRVFDLSSNELTGVKKAEIAAQEPTVDQESESEVSEYDSQEMRTCSRNLERELVQYEGLQTNECYDGYTV